MKWIPASELKDRQHYVKVCGRIVQEPCLYVWGSFHWDGSRKMWHDWIQRPVDESILEILTDESAPTSANTGLRDLLKRIIDAVPMDKNETYDSMPDALVDAMAEARSILSTPPGGERREDIENACIDSLLKEFNRQGFDTSNWDGDEGWDKAIVDGVSHLTGQGDWVNELVQFAVWYASSPIAEAMRVNGASVHDQLAKYKELTQPIK